MNHISQQCQQDILDRNPCSPTTRLTYLDQCILKSSVKGNQPVPERKAGHAESISCTREFQSKGLSELKEAVVVYDRKANDQKVRNKKLFQDSVFQYLCFPNTIVDNISSNVGTDLLVRPLSQKESVRVGCLRQWYQFTCQKV